MENLSKFKIILISTSILVSVFLFAFAHFFNQNIINKLHNKQIQIYTENSKLKIKSFIESKENLLKTLSNHKNVIDFKNNNSEKIINLLKDFLKADKLIMQIRILDLQANEKIRIDRQKDKILVKNQKELQNKSSRYYIKEFMQLQNNRLGISKLDLNVEYGKIEKPFKSTIRLAMPIFEESKKKYLLIINYNMNTFLNDLFYSSFFDIFLVDKKGYFIVHPKKDYNWSEFTKDKLTKSNYFLNKKYKTIQKKYQVFNEEYEIVFKEKDKKNTNSFFNENTILSILVLSAIILIVFPFIYILLLNLRKIKNLNNSLNENLIKLESIFNYTSDSIILIDLKGIIKEVNSSTEEIFKYKKDELIGKNINILVPSPHHEKHNEYLKNHNKDIKNRIIGVDRELYGLDKNGQYVPISLMVTKVIINEEEHFIGTIKNLSKEVKSKKLFEDIFNSSSVGTALVLKDGSFWRMNNRFAQIVGYSIDELIQLTFQDITHKDDLEKDLSLVYDILNGKIENYSIDKRYIHKNGQIVWVKLNVKGVYTDSSKKELEYFISNIDDITEQVELRSKLVETVKIAYIGHWSWKIHEDVLEWSDNMRLIFGLAINNKKLNYGTFINIVHKDDRDYVNKKVKECFSTKSDFDILYRIVVDNKIKFIHAKGKLTLNDNEPIEFFGTCQDITKVKILEEDQKSKELMLMEQSKMASMGEMIGAIAHQWRQPLNSIGYIVQDLLSAYKHNEFNEEYLEEVKTDMMSQLNYMSDTIDQFRNYFKAEEPYKEFNLIDCILEVNKLFNSQLINYKLELILLVENKEFEQLSKEEIETFNTFTQNSQLKQVLINCIANAKDAILELKNPETKQKVIEIELSKNSENINISINDLAGGISSTNQKRIFEPYYTTKNMGTGLGLYICQMIARKSLKGDIIYKTNSKIINDKKLLGSSFIISIPKTIHLE